jgi:hypothetical protein
MEGSEEPEILVNGEPVLVPDPNFGVEWPDDVRLLCARLFNYDPEVIRGRDRLGDLSFDEAPGQLETIRQIVKDLSLERWDELPPNLANGGLLGQLQEVCNVLDAMTELSSTSETPADRRANLSNQLSELLNWFRQEAAPRATNAKIQRFVGDGFGGQLDTANAERLRSEYDELSARLVNLKAELDSSQEAVSQARAEAGDSASKELEAVYKERSVEYAGTATKWLIALIVAVPVAAILAIVIFNEVRPDEGANNPHDYAALGLGIFLLGLIAFGVRVCAQNFRVNRHLSTVARSKQSAISTFQRLSASVADDDVRSAVTLTLAQSIFTVEETGLVDGSGDHVTLVERAVIPNLPKAG